MSNTPVPFKWQIRCTKFQPALFDRGLLGFANFELPGGLVLADGRIYRTPRGGICVKFRELGVLSANEPARRENGTLKTLRPISFADYKDWMAFSDAAVAAVRAAYSDAIPEVRCAKPCALHTHARANQEFHHHEDVSSATA